VSEVEDRYSKARRAAEALWIKDKKRAAEVVSKKEKERNAGALKTQRLRELRLAKEAAEKQAAAPRSRTSRWGKT